MKHRYFLLMRILILAICVLVLRQFTNRKPSQEIRNIKKYSDIVQNSKETEITLLNCPVDEIDWYTHVQPRYELDPNKFMLPVLYNGPNNQLLGFHQSILVAIILNRTLILPTFYEHGKERVVFRPLIDASQRVDVDRLRQLISVVPLHQARHFCDGRVEEIMPAGKAYLSKATLPQAGVRLQMETGLQIVNYNVEMTEDKIEQMKSYFYNHEELKDPEVKSWITDQGLDWTNNILNKGNSLLAHVVLNLPEDQTDVTFETLKENYASDKKCIMYYNPFRQLGYKEPLPDKALVTGRAKMVLRDPTRTAVTKSDGNILYSEIFRNIHPPVSVKNFFEKFRQDVISPASPFGYITVHWRYDETDFFSYLCENHARNERNTFCRQISTAKNSTKLALVVIKTITEMREISEQVIRAVYFAAPPSMLNFVNEVKDEFYRYVKLIEVKEKMFGRHYGGEKLKFLTMENLKTHLYENYKTCDWLQGGRFFDTLSLIEMNLCKHSSAFLFSKQSTWSKNIIYQRSLLTNSLTLDFDLSIVDAALKISEDFLFK